MPEAIIWVFYDRRTNPTTIHRYAENGEPSAVEIQVMKQPDTDGGTETRVESVCKTGAGNTPALTHLPLDWETADWSNNTWPHGILWVGLNEYEDPHGTLAAAENKRQAAQANANPPPVEVSVDEDTASLPEQTEQTFDPADKDKDGVVSKSERKQHKRENE